MSKRIFIDPQHLPHDNLVGQSIKLPADTLHYIYTVLRMTPGQPLHLTDGQGRLLHTQTPASTNDPFLITEDQHQHHNESPRQIHLYQAIPKGERWSFVLEKTTELGVSAITPITTSRTVVNIPPQKQEAKHQRWLKILQSATRQCQRDLTPQLHPITTFQQAISQLQPHDHNILCHTQPSPSSLPQTLSPQQTISLWIGPEGGFTDAECQHFLQHPNTHIIQLGPRILRTETAAITTLAILQHRYGDL